MAIGKNKLILYSAAIVATSVASYFLLRKRKLEFYDNVWCEDGNCCNIKITDTGYDLVECFSGFNADGDVVEEENTGNVNLLFLEPHGLKKGDTITVSQDANAPFPSYDGKTRVSKVFNDHIIMLDKSRAGSSPIIGGSVMVDSLLNRWFGL